MFASAYKVAFATVGVQSRMGELVPLTFSSIFVNVAAPAGGMTSLLAVQFAITRASSGASFIFDYARDWLARLR